MPTNARTIRWLRWTIIAGAALTTALAYVMSASVRGAVDRAVAVLTAGDVAALRDYILSFGVWAPIVSALLMIFQAIAAPLPAFLIAFANGLAFGTLWGGLLSLTSATVAAAMSFWLARVLGRDAVEALAGRTGVAAADRWFARYGAYAVLIARLIPIVSFDVISYAAGLTRMTFWSFLIATVIGMLPATFTYSYLGEQAPQYVSVLLVVFGVIIAAALLAALLRRRQRSG